MTSIFLVPCLIKYTCKNEAEAGLRKLPQYYSFKILVFQNKNLYWQNLHPLRIIYNLAPKKFPKFTRHIY